MLWKNHILYLIDFDEAIVATQEYEVISSVIKLCFHYNDFDIQLAKELLKEYENQMNLSIQNLKCMWEFYILKVILEKIALYQMGKIDLSDPRQKKDGWEKWYNLLNDLNLTPVSYTHLDVYKRQYQILMILILFYLFVMTRLMPMLPLVKLLMAMINLLH